MKCWEMSLRNTTYQRRIFIIHMDDKGVQLRVGGRVLTLVDWDQKSVKHVEGGNRELVTIIECVAAGGSSIQLSVVFKGVRCNLEWGCDNLCNARYEFALFSAIVI